MNVTEIIEHEDGGATLQMSMTGDEVKQVIEVALRIGLMKGLLMEEAELDKELEKQGYKRIDEEGKNHERTE